MTLLRSAAALGDAGVDKIALHVGQAAEKVMVTRLGRLARST
jgi:hypothetical protein